MGTVPWAVYAPTRRKQHWNPPDGLDWATVERKVKRLQMRIAQAAKEGKHRKMRSLQWLLAHSFCGKLLAVRRVTSNKGKNTPGVDGVVWRTSRQKSNAVRQLHRRGYRAMPLRRVYIPKKSGKLRPLGIPVMGDRAMQALYNLTMIPIAETFADANSYGFRQGRSCADAIEQVFNSLCKKTDSQWILDADIASCFDQISHQWLLENIPMDKKILGQWLRCGFLDKGELFPTLRGTPQGGITSPTLMNMTLDGLERTARKSVPFNVPGTNRRNGVSVIRYADDFVITAKTEEFLEKRVLPAIRTFLEKRGLSLSEEKTGIVHINKGFDFLGQRVRKYRNGKLIITPSRKSVQGLQEAVRRILDEHRGDEACMAIRRLNQTITGWCNYHRHACSHRTFRWIDTWLFYRIKHWLHYRHPNKGRWWIVKRYYRIDKNKRWWFHSASRHGDGKMEQMEQRELVCASRTRIVRHVKVKAQANPYDPAWSDYFHDRKVRKRYFNSDRRFVEERGCFNDAKRLREA